MKRAGFTMIELIFVIVILGILAAVAVPKLAATRTDAKVAAEVTAVAQAVQNLGAEYVATGAITDTSLATATASANCFTLTEVTDGNVTVTPLAAANTACPADVLAEVKLRGTQSGMLEAAGAAKVHQFGGAAIVR